MANAPGPLAFLRSFDLVINASTGAATINNGGANPAIFSSMTKYIRIQATCNCRVRLDNGVLATATDALVVGPNPAEIILSAGRTTISVIGDGATTGKLNVTELSQ